MSRIIDISDDSLKKFHLSDNILNTISNDDFQTIKVSQLTNIYKNEKFFHKNDKITSLKDLEKTIHKYFIDLYYHDEDFYYIKVIDDIINNYDTHLVAEFKDYLIMGDDSEFLQKKYSMAECKKYLPTLFDYYKSCSVIFPNYVILQENKYIFKNIRKKQKVIDNQQEQDDKMEKIKNGEINLDENEDFFTSKAFNSILNQTNTSNVKLFFGINSKNKVNDSEETVNNIFKKIVKAEKDAFAIKKNYILKKRNFKNILNTNYEIKSKINTYNINNLNNLKLNKKRNDNNFLNTKFSYNKIKNMENNKNYQNIPKNPNTQKENDNNKIKILYSNKNKIEKAKIINKLNTSKKHIKSNTCIFETDINEKFHKKVTFLNRNNSSNKKVFKKINSNKKLSCIKEKKKKEIITNKELISKIMEKIKNSKSAIFNGHNSYQTFNQKKKFILNIKENTKINSLSPTLKINSYTTKNYTDRGGGGIILSINESNSTPNIIKLNNSKLNKINKNNGSNFKGETKPEYKMIKVNSNLNISPLNEIYMKKDFYNNIKTNANINYNFTTNNYNYQKNKVLTSNNIKKKIENKKQIKKGENEKDSKKAKKFNLDIYKISPSSITQKYITNSILSPNKAETINNMKKFNESKFGCIKVVKKQKTIDSKKKQRADINNNININININSNNIYNNTNQMNNNSNNNSNASNNILNNVQSKSISINNFNKKKYLESLKKQSNPIIQRNESHPLLKKILLSSSSNRNVYNFKKNFIFEELTKKKIFDLNNNTLTFSGYLTTRNSNNVSKIKNKVKNKIGNSGKSNNNNNKFKKELFNKKCGIILSKNKIPIFKNTIQNSYNSKLKKYYLE